jgi:sulfide dehydrogenase cytochrome subunit
MNLQRSPRRPFASAPLGAVLVVLSLAACGGGGGSDQSGAQQQVTSAGGEVAAGSSSGAALVVQPTNTAGRLLASNCFQCHGTLGNGGFEEIRGKSANELLEFQRKPAGKDIMAAHAQGYTPEQLSKIAAYLKQ